MTTKTTRVLAHDVTPIRRADYIREVDLVVTTDLHHAARAPEHPGPLIQLAFPGLGDEAPRRVYLTPDAARDIARHLTAWADTGSGDPDE